jgi:hypothetical protein
MGNPRAIRPAGCGELLLHAGRALRCDRAGYHEQSEFAKTCDSPNCLVKLYCWGPVAKCNAPMRGDRLRLPGPRRVTATTLSTPQGVCRVQRAQPGLDDASARSSTIGIEVWSRRVSLASECDHGGNLSLNERCATRPGRHLAL